MQCKSLTSQSNLIIIICIANFPKIAQWDIALDRFSIIGGIFRAERNFSLSCYFSFIMREGGQNGGGGWFKLSRGIGKTRNCRLVNRLDGTIDNNEVNITGYDLIRKDRNRNGGGVAIYIRNVIPYTICNHLLSSTVEAICIEINKPNSKPLLISTWYRPPDAKIELLVHFENFLQNIDEEDKNFVITGDFNCNFLSTENNNQHTNKLIELINEYQLQQLITSPTRITPRTKTLLDIIITKIGDTKIIESGVIHLGISDHSLVYACRKVSIPKAKPKVVETRQFKHFNITNFQQDLNQALNSTLFYNCTDANTACYTWKEIFLEIADIHAPVLKRKVKSEYNPWMTNEIKNMSYHRDFLKRKAIKHNSTRYHELYKNCRNRVNNLIKDTKAIYFKNKLESTTNSKEGGEQSIYY